MKVRNGEIRRTFIGKQRTVLGKKKGMKEENTKKKVEPDINGNRNDGIAMKKDRQGQRESEKGERERRDTSVNGDDRTRGSTSVLGVWQR